MSVGNWVETNVVLPLGQLLLEPENLRKIASVFEPLLDRMVNTAISQLGLQVSASELNVINAVAQEVKASEQSVMNNLAGMSNTINGLTGSLGNVIINTIKGLNPFHFP